MLKGVFIAEESECPRWPKPHITDGMRVMLVKECAWPMSRGAVPPNVNLMSPNWVEEPRFNRWRKGIEDRAMSPLERLAKGYCRDA